MINFTSDHPNILPHCRFIIVDGFLTPFSLNLVYYYINARLTIKCEFRNVLIYDYGYRIQICDVGANG
jgi:hypothetical protein